jgi:hypothetical protein
VVRLTDLGFSEGIITETIVSTYDPNGEPNAAPMGVTMEDGHHLTLNFFNSSSTLRNLRVNRCAVINSTSNMEIFYKTAFKEANPGGKLPSEWFEKTEGINAPRMRFADALIDVSVDELKPISNEKTRAVLHVDKVHAKRKYPQVPCRAMSATLEAIIHATRVKVFVNDEKNQRQVTKLLDTIDNCNNVVNRVAPNSSYSAIMTDLMKRVNSWEYRQ